MTALVSQLLDEGLQTKSFPGVVYRDGPTGRRAGLAGGPDIWEVIRAVKLGQGPGEARIEEVAMELVLPVGAVRLAVDFYTAHPEAVDKRIGEDEAAASRIEETVRRRERLMA